MTVVNLSYCHSVSYCKSEDYVSRYPWTCTLKHFAVRVPEPGLAERHGDIWSE